MSEKRRDLYAQAALERECEALASTGANRNNRLNQAAFSLGQFVGAGALDRQTVENALRAAAETNGYLRADGSRSVHATIKSGIESGLRHPRNFPGREGGRACLRHPTTLMSTNAPVLRRPAPRLAGVEIPRRTPPNDDGRPRFERFDGCEPGKVTGEVRRHVYRRDGESIRVKIKKNLGARFVDFYRVLDPATGVTGWQDKKPEGYIPTPYTGGGKNALDPFDPEHITELVFWPEGEKDVDTLQAQGLMAFTFGGSNDVWEGCEAVLQGREVVVLADNDEPGRKCADRKAELAARVATRVRVIHFSELPEKGDVSDWFTDHGGTADELWQWVERSDPVEPPKPLISATPFVWVDPRSLPPREWVYGSHYIRQFISTTVAPGGVGKSSLALVEAIAIATGRDLLDIKPNERTRVWYWNGEDPLEELQRRVAAICIHFGIEREEIEGWLFLDSGRTSQIVIASQTRDGAQIAQPVVDQLEQTIRENKIGVVSLDPFVSIHRVLENDNGMIDAVAKTLAGIADRTCCAMELIHHVRKTNGSEVTIEDGRGAIALQSASRCARAINQMSEGEASGWGVENRRLHFRYYDGKANLAPPADKSTWFKLESVDLGNATAVRPSDKIGIVTRWEPPAAFDNVTTDHLHAVRRRVAESKWRLNEQSEDWVGYAIADVLDLDITSDKTSPACKTARRRIKTMIETWLKTGALKKVDNKDSKGNWRPFVTAGEWSD
jgi:hypothetical protein